MKKKTAKKTAPLNAKLRELIATAASIGYTASASFAAGVELARNIARVRNSKVALVEAGLQYKAGYVARYLEGERAFAKRWDNMDQSQRIAEAADIYGRPYPESSKPNRRTELEHRACRAADVSWSGCKRRAGLIAEKKGGRKPRPAANASKPVPVDLVKASPKLPNKAAANDYFATACAALLATVDKNARIVMPQVSSALTDLRAAFVAAGIMEPVSK